MGFIRQIKQRGKIYFAEVENHWINGKCVQKHIRSFGTDPEHPTNIKIEPVHFSYLALRLIQEALTPNDLFEMLEKMGQSIRKEDLEGIGINYDFEKKTYSISLFYKKKSRSRNKTDAKDARNIQKPKQPTNEE
jgi:hypothetical protein